MVVDTQCRDFKSVGVVQKEMQSKVAMLSDEVKRKAQHAAAQSDEAAQARANEAAALKKAALLEQQVADLQVRPGTMFLPAAHVLSLIHI